MILRRFAVWLGVVSACVLTAVLLAFWWSRWAAASFQASLRDMPTLRLMELARSRDWDPAVFYWLGLRQSFEGRDRDATYSLSRSIALNPNSAPAYAALGVVLGRAGQFPDAERAFKQALAIDPKLQFAHYALGSLYARHQVWPPAIEELKAAIAQNPRDVEARFQLAKCYGEVYQEDRKQELLQQLIREYPRDTRFLKEIGYTYLFYGRFAEAESTYRRIIAAAPEDYETHYLLGRALAEQANTPEAFSRAESELKGVVAHVKDEPGVYLALGILYQHRNEPERAIPEFQRAIDLGEQEQKTWLYLGQCYLRTGKEAEGKAALARFERTARIKRTITQLENRLLNLPAQTPAQRRERTGVQLRLARVYMEDANYPRALNNLHSAQAGGDASPELRQLMRECRRHVPAAAGKP